MGSSLEVEYGIKTWWTTEFYLDGQTTRNESTIFTGYRWENRFRPLLREHGSILCSMLNLKTSTALIRHYARSSATMGRLTSASRTTRSEQEKKREIELKLILGSNFKGWNVSENIIVEKNLANEPWEFGYAVGASRPLKLEASPKPCTFCLEKWQAGVEMYGGLGDRYSFGTRLTSQFLGPTVNWSSPNGVTLSFSPSFGLNDYSVPRLYRFGIGYRSRPVPEPFPPGQAVIRSSLVVFLLAAGSFAAEFQRRMAEESAATGTTKDQPLPEPIRRR